tara:strand:+ start:364 stop:2214 length:1851 start_codon:yes stop_codon:yes gene_type:complete
MLNILKFALLSLSLVLLATGFSEAQSFTDDFDRADGSIGNGWIDSPDNPGADLEIIDQAVTMRQFSRASIYRPVDQAAEATLALDVSEKNGFGGLLRQYETFIFFRSDGTSANSYGILVQRTDQNYDNSGVHLVKNGQVLESQLSGFQFGARIRVSVTQDELGKLSGSITEGASVFNFSFTHEEIETGGSFVRIQQEVPDSRSGRIVWPTIDNVSIQAGSESETDFEQPLAGTVQITQDFDCYDCVKTKQFHTGVDLISTEPSVRATASGRVHSVYLFQRLSGYQWCDGSSLGSESSKFGDDQVGFGNTVIIEHDSDRVPGGRLYSQYSHLDCISRELADGFLESSADVGVGEFIGNFGNTGTVGRHLHFETKTTPTLGQAFLPNGTRKEVGYTNARALSSAVGYVDPLLLLGAISETVEPYLAIVVEDVVDVRPGPGNFVYRCSASIDGSGVTLDGQERIVVRKTVATPSGNWVQFDKVVAKRGVELPVLAGTTCNLDSNYPDTNEPDGWIKAEQTAPYFGTTLTIQRGDANGLVDVVKSPSKPDKTIGLASVGQMFSLDSAIVSSESCLTSGLVKIPLAGSFEYKAKRQAKREAKGKPPLDAIKEGWICGDATQ